MVSAYQYHLAGIKVQTFKGCQAVHLHRRETFENLLHIASVRRTLSGI